MVTVEGPGNKEQEATVKERGKDNGVKGTVPTRPHSSVQRWEELERRGARSTKTRVSLICYLTSGLWEE